jgi:hypothetical protein
MRSPVCQSINFILPMTLRVESEANDRLIDLFGSPFVAVGSALLYLCFVSGIGSREVKHLGYILHPIKRPRAMKFRTALTFHHVRTRSVCLSGKTKKFSHRKNCVSPRVLSFTPKAISLNCWLLLAINARHAWTGYNMCQCG